MANPFATYAKKAATIAKHHSVPLVGVTKTWRQAMIVYQEIVSEIRACDDRDSLECYLAGIQHHIKQFKAELDFLWRGDGEDFIGLSGEIENAMTSLEVSQFPENPESGADRSFGYFDADEGLRT